MTANVETMMYVGEVPWHGLGTKMDALCSSKEAIIAAGLNWKVQLMDVYRDGFGTRGKMIIPDYKAVTRETDGTVYSLVKNRYTPLQNEAAFSFFDSVIKTGEALIECAGSLENGAKVWILAKMKDSIKISKNDIIQKYILLVNSHDGSFALMMFWTPVRVVCANTLASALSTATEKFYARHTKNISNKVDAAREILGLTNQYYKEFTEKAQFLLTQKMPKSEMPLLLHAAFVPEIKLLPAADPKMYSLPDYTVHTARTMELVTRLYEGEGKGLDTSEVRGTKWAAFNAVSEFTDHYKNYRGGEDGRLNGVWFGTGETIKQRAWDYLLK
jgi:phage/plasmid-like protein (TIGR03299 family)